MRCTEKLTLKGEGAWSEHGAIKFLIAELAAAQQSQKERWAR